MAVEGSFKLWSFLQTIFPSLCVIPAERFDFSS